MKHAVFVIPSTALYPLDEEHRLRIYARVGKRLSVVAATDFEGLGPALRQLDEDEAEQGRRLCDLGAIGVLDVVAGRWLIPCWHRPDPSHVRAPLPDTNLIAMDTETHRQETGRGAARRRRTR